MYFNRSVQIGGVNISDESPVFIIAEIGVNHNGDILLAKKMIDIASEAGVNAVKFQSFHPEELVDKDAPKANYQLETTDKKESQFEMLKKLMLSIDKMEQLKIYAEQKGLIFLSTPFDEKSLEELESIQVDGYKISSTDTTNLLFLKKVARSQRPIILSTGMTTLEEIEKAVRIIYEHGNKDLILLHCTANYPTAVEEVNMMAIKTIAEKFGTLVGYSDHTEGVGVAPYTIPLGVKIVEKHFTLDKTLEGPDHRASLNPEELAELVKKIRYVESALGNGIKKPTPSEKITKPRMQKNITVKQDIIKGTVLQEDMLTAKRSSKGISAIHVLEIVGKKFNRDIKKDEFIELNDFDE